VNAADRAPARLAWVRYGFDTRAFSFSITAKASAT
jgi:hypothetical protein